MSTERRKVVIMPYKLRELALIYKVSCYFMRLRISKHKKAIGKREGHFYDTDQVEKIFDLIRVPSDVDVIKYPPTK